MEMKKETCMTVEQLKLLLEYLPDGVMLEISWEGADGSET